jgi:hypothetical protein
MSNSAGSRRLAFVRRVVCALGVAASGCAAYGDSRDLQNRAEVIVWKKLGSWSGHGLLQTTPFENDTGMLKVDWQARADTTETDRHLRVILHSAVSGRSLSVPVDHRGDGRGTVFVNEDPRGFFLLIESRGLEWTVDVAEGIPARQRAR